MAISDSKRLIEKLCELPAETEWVEFKTNYFNPEDIGKYVSALSNSAMLYGKRKAYLIFGIKDGTHEIVGTNVRLKQEKKGNENFEHWLNKHITPRINIQFDVCYLDGRHLEIIEIEPGYDRPVRFNNSGYIRIDSANQHLSEYPEKERTLWNLTSRYSFEEGIASTHYTVEDIWQNFHCREFSDAIYSKNLSDQNIIGNFVFDKFIVDDQEGKYDITNLFALCCAKNISNFTTVSNKTPRVIKYKSNNKLHGESDISGRMGYVVAFQKLLKWIMDNVDKREAFKHGVRHTEHFYPEPAIREFLANALIHQDLISHGDCPKIEIFKQKIVISNPGKPLISTDRFIDAPSKSRNEKLASVMRKAGLCEERGSGIDRALYAIEGMLLAPPLFQTIEDSTIITLFMNKNFSSFTKEDRIRACYQHAVLRFLSDDPMNNLSLRARFGLNKNQSQQVSEIIRESIDDGKIKPLREEQGKKHAKYVPWWA